MTTCVHLCEYLAELFLKSEVFKVIQKIKHTVYVQYLLFPQNHVI